MSATPQVLSEHGSGSLRFFPFPRSFAIVLLALAPLIALTVYGNLTRLFQGNFNEGWNAYHALSAFSPRQLYPDDVTWTISNYPPGSFLAVAVLSGGAGRELLVGKLLSLLGLGLMALAAWKLLRLSLPPAHSAYGAAFVAAYYALVFPVYVAANDPQMLALGTGLLAFSLAVESARTSGPQSLTASALLFALALFVKHNIIGLPLAALFFLYLNHRKAAWRLLLYLAALGAFSALAYQIVYGTNFWIHLLAKRSYSLAQAKTIWKDLLGQASLPLAIAFLGLLSGPRSRDGSWLALALGLSGTIALAFSGGGGIGTNMFFDALFFALVACILLFARLAGPAQRTLVFAVMPLTLLLQSAPDLVNRALTFSPARNAEAARQYSEEVAYLKNRPGLAVCDHLLLCFDAGKPLVLDLYWTGESILTGRLDEDVFVKRIESRAFATIQLELPPSVDATKPFPHLRLGPAVVAAILRNYSLDRRSSFHAIFTLKDNS
jgi:hypothetical protein